MKVISREGSVKEKAQETHVIIEKMLEKANQHKDFNLRNNEKDGWYSSIDNDYYYYISTQGYYKGNYFHIMLFHHTNSNSIEHKFAHTTDKPEPVKAFLMGVEPRIKITLYGYYK